MKEKSNWSLDIKKMPWVEDTEREVDFLIRRMNMRGRERILDLACGFGRHSIAFAERGFDVVGVDITPAYIKDARRTAENRHVQIEFVCSDIRDLNYCEEFDVVLNLADGAVGYLGSDEENLKIFDQIAAALKPGGKHFMDICNRNHAERYFPKKSWKIGSQSLSLAELNWNGQNKRMLYSGCTIPFGKPAKRPVFADPYPGIRLYSKQEISEIMAVRGMKVLDTFCDYSGSPDSCRQLQLMIYSQKGRAGCEECDTDI